MDVRLTGVYIADARLVSEGVAQPEDAMAVFVGRAGKGRIAPFTVRRSYTGAGGWYREAMAVLAPNGDVVWRSPERALTLRGTSKIDTFTDEVHGVVVDSDDDHELVLLVGGDEVGRVPVAVLDEDPPWSRWKRRSRRARWSGSRSRARAGPAAGPCPSGTAPSTAASTSSSAGPSSMSPGWPRPTGRC